MITQIGSLDNEGGNEDEFVIGGRQVLQGDIIEGNVEVYFGVFRLNKVEMDGYFFDEVKESFGFFLDKFVDVFQSEW